ncbi:hypothetical protein [Vreelandella sp. GE22]
MNKCNKVKTVISDKSYPLPIEMRPLWRICLIVVSLAVVSGDKRYLDVKKVNILVWILIRRARWDEYEEFLHGRSEDTPLVSVDTAMFKAFELAIAKEILTLEAGRIYMTKNAVNLYVLLIENGIMQAEIAYLKKNGKKLTDHKVKELTGGLL